MRIRKVVIPVVIVIIVVVGGVVYKNWLIRQKMTPEREALEFAVKFEKALSSGVINDICEYVTIPSVYLKRTLQE